MVDVTCERVIFEIISRANIRRIYEAEKKITEMINEMKVEPGEMLLIAADIIVSALLAAFASCITISKDRPEKCLEVPSVLFCIAEFTYKVINQIIHEAVKRAGGLSKDVVEQLKEIVDDFRLLAESYLED